MLKSIIFGDRHRVIGIWVTNLHKKRSPLFLIERMRFSNVKDVSSDSNARLSGSSKQMNILRYPWKVLHEWTTKVFLSLGVPNEDAVLASDVLSCSDLRGIDSHGVARMKTYVELLRAGRINPKAKISIIRENETTATVDGDNGLGLVVAPKANKIAMDKATKFGTGFVSVCNSNHYGIAGYYVLEALKRDLIGWSMTNTTKLVVPLWGADAMLGTNPIAIAFPGKKSAPIVIDMATSAVAYGKVEIAGRQGKELPEGWCVDSEGKPTTSTNTVLNEGGSLLPLGVDRERGAHKGYCLSLMVDILCSLLSGANWGPFVPPFTLSRHEDPRTGTVGKGIGHFFGAMRIDGFCDTEDFKARVDHYRSVFSSSRAANGSPSPPLLPGDPERLAEQTRRLDGIPLLPAVIADLRTVGELVGVPFVDQHCEDAFAKKSLQ